MGKVEIPKRDKFSPPKSHPTFVKKWKSLIEEIKQRDNFKDSHIFQLEVLCDLYVEYELLTEIVNQEGYTYSVAEGRNGPQIKPRPELAQLNHTRSMIKDYSKQLGFVLQKDSVHSKEKEVDEWS